MRFIVLDVDSESSPRNRALPLVLSVPEEIKHPNPVKAKEWVLRAVAQKITERSWRWNKKYVLSESDAESSPEIRKMFEFVNWDCVPKIWMEMPEDHNEAYEYVKLVGPSPSVENLLANNSNTAYRYAMDILEGKFSIGEKAIGEDPLKSINYAKKTKSRIIAGEDAISKKEELSLLYGKIMKQYNLWDSWSEEDVSRSPVWMYQYAKDYMGGSLPENLHNRMHLMSFSNCEDKWIKKYLGAKKYMSRKVKKGA